MIRSVSAKEQAMRVIDLNKDDDRVVNQAANILHSAFREHWPDAWANLDEAIEEIHEMCSAERIRRVAVNELGEIVGLIGGMPSYGGRVWELHPLAVRVDQQRCGIGRLLIVDFEEQVKQRGGLTIMLGSDDVDEMTSLSNVDLYENLPDKIASIRNLKGHPYGFYQAAGYTIIGVLPDANGVGKPDILLGKRVAV